MDSLSTLPDDLIERIASMVEQDDGDKYDRAGPVAVWALAQTNKKIRTAFPLRTLRWAWMGLRTRIDPYADATALPADKQPFGEQLAGERKSKKLLKLADNCIEYGGFIPDESPSRRRAFRRNFERDNPEYGVAEVMGDHDGGCDVPISIDYESDFFYVTAPVGIEGWGGNDVDQGIVRAFRVGESTPLAEFKASAQDVGPADVVGAYPAIPTNHVCSLASRGRWLLVRYPFAVQKYELCTNALGEHELVCRWTCHMIPTRGCWRDQAFIPCLCHVYLDATPGEPGAHGIVGHGGDDLHLPIEELIGHAHWDIEKQRAYESRGCLGDDAAEEVYTWHVHRVRLDRESLNGTSNGREIAIPSLDGDVIWIRDAKTFQLLQAVGCPYKLKSVKSVGMLHRHHILAALSPNGQFLAYTALSNHPTKNKRKVLIYTRNADGIFSSEKGEIYEYYAPEAPSVFPGDCNVRSLKFTACSRFLIVTAYNGTMERFDFSPTGFLPNKRRPISPHHEKEASHGLPDMRRVCISEESMGSSMPEHFFPWEVIWLRSSLLVRREDGSFLSICHKRKPPSEGATTSTTSA